VIERSRVAPVLVLQHQDVVAPAWLGDVLDEAGIEMHLAAVQEGAPVPGRGAGAAWPPSAGRWAPTRRPTIPFLAERKRFLRQPLRSWHQGTSELSLAAKLLAASVAYPQAFRRWDALGVRRFHRGGHR
jgi:hypothetical protein